MIIISHVATQFENPDGGRFVITAAQRNILQSAPDWIRKTSLFAALAEDGSVETAETKAQKLRAENHLTSGITAEGKKEPVLRAEEKPSAGKRTAAELKS